MAEIPLKSIKFHGLDNVYNVPEKLSELQGDESHRTVTDAEKAAWDAKQPAGNYATKLELSNGLAEKQNIIDRDWVLLWENTNPQGIYPEGTITTKSGYNIGNYPLLAILCTVSYKTNALVGPFMVVPSWGRGLMQQIISEPFNEGEFTGGDPVFQSRSLLCNPSDNTIYFYPDTSSYNGKFARTGGAVLIPYRVYGVKS